MTFKSILVYFIVKMQNKTVQFYYLNKNQFIQKLVTKRSQSESSFIYSNNRLTALSILNVIANASIKMIKNVKIVSICDHMPIAFRFSCKMQMKKVQNRRKSVTI